MRAVRWDAAPVTEPPLVERPGPRCTGDATPASWSVGPRRPSTVNPSSQAWPLPSLDWWRSIGAVTGTPPARWSRCVVTDMVRPRLGRGLLRRRSLLARRERRRTGGAATRTPARNHRRGRDLDNEGLIPVLARAVREVEAIAQRGPVKHVARVKFQVVALLMREERARLKADTDLSRVLPHRAAQAARRHRHDPRQDDRPRHLAAGAAGRGRDRRRRRQDDEARDDRGRRPGGRARARRRGGPRHRGRPRPPGAAAVGGLPPAGQPVPGAGLLQRDPRGAAPPAGHLGAPRPALPLLRGGHRRRHLLHGAARAGLAPGTRRPTS